MRRAAILLAGALAWPAAASALPAPPPSTTAGAAQQRSQQEQQRLERSQRRKGPKGPVLVGPKQQHAKPAPGGAKFTLNHITFSPSRFLSSSTLQALSRPYLHHPITVADLYKLLDAINAVYAKRGLITDRAILPPQKVTGGVVHVRLVEGKVGAVHLSGAKHTGRGYILARLPVRQGTVLDAAELERELIWFDRTSDVALKANLQPGSRFGLTDVMLEAIEPPRYQVSLLANNEGDRATGRVQGGVYARLFGPLGRGDSLTLYAMKSRGAFNGNLGYQVPLTRRGLKLSASVAHNEIHIIDGPYRNLDIRGHADVGQLGLTRPLVASRHWLVTTAGSVSYTRDRTDISGVPLNADHIWTPAAGVTAEYDRPGQSWLVTQTAERGFAHEVLSQDRAYWLLPGTFSGRAALPGPLFTTTSAGWQYSNARDLPPSQLFQLGGANTVPGYPVGTASGVRGFYARQTLDVHLPARTAFGVGYSYGALHAAYPRRIALESFDVGLQGRLPRYRALEPVSWRVDVAHPMRTVVPDESKWEVYFSIVAPFGL
ncbi:MAG TPA: ShlB/FhaC/HecB family hemolysin secretion/activation protein [Gammaproteobacteria bacterium]|nr:ShlB/FhaC/HecB family hemolysin secretion/activation protein [Gammaproteobacteria bacterium]